MSTYIKTFIFSLSYIRGAYQYGADRVYFTLYAILIIAHNPNIRILERSLLNLMTLGQA